MADRMEQSMAGVVTRRRERRVGILSIDAPPVNAFSAAVRRDLLEAAHLAIADASIDAIVIACAGRTFVAGADLAEFGKPFAAPDFNEVIATLEESVKPVIAALHGAVLGGGFELMLGTHYRIAHAGTRLGLPEVTFGLLPGAGGTQRLPRLCGAEQAFDLIRSGRSIDAVEALRLGIVDRVAEGNDVTAGAVDYAVELLAAGAPPRPVRAIEIGALAPAMHERLRAVAAAPSTLPAVTAIATLIEAAYDRPFDRALAEERQVFDALMTTKESVALRYLFAAEREASRLPPDAAGASPRPIETIAILGAGTMGRGIAMCFLDASLPVTLVETTQEALDRGVAAIRSYYEASARKGRIAAEEIDHRMCLLHPTLDWETLRQPDLIVEAVFESLPLKKQIFKKLESFAKPAAILASNTSFLDLDEIAYATTMPERVIGLHFFSPANIMRLLEVVRGARTSPDVIATGLTIAKKIGKLAVLSRVGPGFIANRAMDARRREAERLLLEGVTPERIDRILTDYGFPMGQFAMMDLVGLDVMDRDSEERTLMGDLVAIGRLGQKQGGGYFDYDESRRPLPAAIVADVIAAFAEWKGIEQHSSSDGDILARLLDPVILEGHRLIEEGIAVRASDIDVALVAGYGWPAYTGGPMHWSGSRSGRLEEGEFART